MIFIIQDTTISLKYNIYKWTWKENKEAHWRLEKDDYGAGWLGILVVYLVTTMWCVGIERDIDTSMCLCNGEKRHMC